MLQKIIDSFLKIDVFRKIYVKFNYFALQILTKYIKRPSFYKLEKIGSDYGGWFVPTELITSDWICYCAGVGEDITFDLGLIDRFSCHIYAFDPTPKAAAYVAKTASNQPKFHFFEVGLWSEDKTLKFFAPKNPNHVSHSVVNLQRTDDFFEASCKKISSIMKEIGHEKIDLLKMDVEGAEYEVLNNMIESGINVGIIGVEFDQPVSLLKTWNMIVRLTSWQYDLVNIDGWNYTFIKKNLNQNESSS